METRTVSRDLVVVEHPSGWAEASACAGRRSTTSHAPLGLDRNKLGAFLVQAGISSPRDHALGVLLAVNGLRIGR